MLPASQATYATCRRAAADFIHTHPDDFLPFLPSEVGEDTAGATEAGFMTRAQFDRYCARMRDTAIWGGEPEVVALSRAYGVAIHVVQGGQPPVVVHDPADPAGQKTEAEGGKRTVYISYHRRLYGLGEVSVVSRCCSSCADAFGSITTRYGRRRSPTPSDLFSNDCRPGSLIKCQAPGGAFAMGFLNVDTQAESLGC